MSTALDYAPYDIEEVYGEKTQIISPRLLELRSKIHDSAYLDSAINRIAYILSKNLIDNPEELQLNSSNNI